MTRASRTGRSSFIGRAVSGVVPVLLATACGGDDGAAPTGVGGDAPDSGGTETGGASGAPSASGGTSSTGGDGSGTGGVGGDALVLNGCDGEAAYDELTADDASRYIDWSLPSQSCLKIEAGQSVIWSGDFDAHPLEAYGGDEPSPISFYGVGVGEHEVTFDAPGVYGFHCYVHGESMQGTVWVVL